MIVKSGFVSTLCSMAKTSLSNTTAVKTRCTSPTFAPYSMERHADLVAFAQTSERCQAETLGLTLDGQTLDCLRFGEPDPQRKTIWMVARQHPGESPWRNGGWKAWSIVSSITPTRWSMPMLEKAVIYLVPNMNPGWQSAGPFTHQCSRCQPEPGMGQSQPGKQPGSVLCVLEKMQQTGLDFGLDVHGDEALPYNFIAGTEGIPGWNARNVSNSSTCTRQTLAKINPDFQVEHGYPANTAGNANMSYCSNSLAERIWRTGDDAGNAIQGYQRNARSAFRAGARSAVASSRIPASIHCTCAGTR